MQTPDYSEIRARQAQQMAHLRPLSHPRCRVCSRTATQALYTGLNDHMADYCSTHGKAALKQFKDTGRFH
jgi:hypothetical protein